MNSKVKLVKKANQSIRVAPNNNLQNERQRNREIVGAINRWIDEFKLQSELKTEAALALLIK
jgi:hypothetical protein